MFVITEKYDCIRKGSLTSGNKKVETPCFFMTSDFGGGGTNVSRLLVYSDIFINTNLQLLMNYYYLDINSDLEPRFDTGLIKELQNYDDIGEFIQYIKMKYLTGSPKKAVSKFKYDVEKIWNPIFLLDSGSGNILRGMIKRRELTHDNYKQEYEKTIKNYFEFATSKKFDILIAIDFAGKNTLKDNEMSDTNYVDGVNEFSSNEKNLELLRLTLNFMKQEKPNINVLAPVHGKSPKEYEDYTREILELEKVLEIRFSGFAIGGLGNPNQIDREIWGISNKVNGRVKAANYLIKIVTIIRKILNENNDNRLIHVLGAASPYNLLPLIYAGCDTFDCHSAWRRASDGNNNSKSCVFNNDNLKKLLSQKQTVSFSKMVVPLLGPDTIIAENNKKYLEFVDLNLYNYKCSCEVCKKMSLEDLKKLYCGTDEENYYAKILIYFHNVLQYDYICQRTRNMINDKKTIKDFIDSIPESQYKNDMLEAMFLNKSKNLLDY